jgi:phenylacetate-CoA ligase
MALLGTNLWSWVLRRSVLPLGAKLFRQNISKELAFLEAAQWWDASRIRDLQEQRLRRLLRIAYDEVPFYRSLFDKAGMSWKDIRSREDLAALPVVTKAMLRSEYPHGTTRNTGFPIYEARSSGSTGDNFCVYEDSETAGVYRAFFMLGLTWAGWRIGEPHLQTGMTLQRSLDRKLKDWLFRCSYVSAFDLSDVNLDSVINLMDRRRISHLWGYPGSLYYIAKRARMHGWDRPLTSIVTWGDNLYPHYRETIESVYQTKVFDTYGCGEGIQIAAQCGKAAHYHINALNVIVELVDEKGQNVPPGQPGRVVLTRLHPGPMPLIRYSVGDVAVASTATSCPCGRHLEILDSIQGRDTDVVLTPSGNRLIVHFFTGILEHFAEIQHFQIIQSQRSMIEVRIVPTQKAGSLSVLAARIEDALKQKGLTEMDIHVKPMAEIPPAASGKRRFVINQIAHS